MSSVWLYVLARDPEGAKTRLAPVLGPESRRDLALAMLEDVLSAAGEVAFARRFVVTESAAMGAVARAAGFEVLEAPAAGTNAAAAGAFTAAAHGGAGAAMVIASDLPLLTPSDLEALLAAAREADVVLAPDVRGRGTNALLLAPPRRIRPAFGPDSFMEHRRAARQAGARLAVVTAAGLSRDLDDAGDLEATERDAAIGRRTAAALRRAGRASIAG